MGLFDTKSGFTQQLAGPKLTESIDILKVKTKRKETFGGIVTNTDALKFYW